MRTEPMHIHLVAVAGTGMGALAGLLGELGHEVSGSDTAFYPPMGPALEAWGVRCMPGFDARHLDPPPDLVVIGNVCRKDNPEARAAIDRGLRFTHIAGALSEFVLPGTAPLVVGGTHGKTTTSALAAWLLEGAGRGPGFLIGGIPENFGRSFRAARGAKPRLPMSDAPERGIPFVIEGDEYDTAFFEKTPKFIHYGAEVAIVTSIEHDHIDIYPTLERYLEAFRTFVAGVPEDGLVVANAADPDVVRVVSEAARAPIAWFALEGEATGGLAPHWLAAPASMDATGTSFDLFAGGVACGRYAVPSTGKHNLKNALAAIAAVSQGYGVRLEALGSVLARFAGVKRRQELLGEPRGVYVYDDFAHHPTAVRETLAALHSRHPQSRLIAVFEPRSATACRRIHQDEYAESFSAADEIYLAPLGRSGLPEDERLDVEQVAARLRGLGKRAEALSSVGAIISRVTERAEKGDVVALLSNGAFDGIHDKLLAALGGPASG